MTYKQALDYLYNRLPVFHLTGGAAYKPGLGNTIQLLNALNNPHLKFKSIHVAGTNGKGSVSHMLAAILQQAGYKTALYTSPHLVDFGERIRINGAMIDSDFVVHFVENHQQLIETIQPSFFELTMAMAFDYFAQNKVDIAIIETGLGGRLDSTNIITPLISVITTIGYDHTEFLGDTLDKIAFEKAGIIKKGIPVVIGEYLPETRPVFEQKASDTGSSIIYIQDSYPVHYVETTNNLLIFQQNGITFQSGLTGYYQLKNCATVLATIDVLNKLNYRLSLPAVQAGFREVTRLTGLRGRWELLSESPLLIADTAHNVQGIASVVEQLKHYQVQTVRIVIGMVNDKDCHGVLQLLPRDAQYYFTNAQVKRALAASELLQQAEKWELKGKAYSTIELAMEAAKQEAGKMDLILITGSNFVVGEALSLI